VRLVAGVTSARQKDLSVQGEKNMSEILNNVLKAESNAKHAWTFHHTIDFNNAEIIDKDNSHIRKMLESRHTAKTVEADNNLFPLLGQYNLLLNKH